MTMCDLVVKGGTVVTASDVFTADIGITGEHVVALASELPMGRMEIDAKGKIVTPGGVDSHCHIEQLSASGLMNADTFETATRSALLGGTTTVIPFAAQHVGMSLRRVVDDYHAAANRGAMADYAFHMIITETGAQTLKHELPDLVREGHSSLKCFLTYDKLRIHDEQFLDLLTAAREHDCMVCVHAENHGMISWVGQRLIERGYTRPPFHAVSHPRLAEQEAINRAITMAALVDQPLMIFHVSTQEGVDVIRRWQAEGQKVFGETCTHYLTLNDSELDKPGNDGGMWVCSPPLRKNADQDVLWRALRAGTLSTVSSDHAPYRMDETGKLANGNNPTFKQIANGMGGLELRMPVMFDAAQTIHQIDLMDFVRLTATEPAKIYGLHPRKGTIAVGSDADLVVWDQDVSKTVSHDMVSDNTGYSPFVDRTIHGWPRDVLRRGHLVVESGRLQAQPGSGTFLARQGGPCARASGKLSPEFDSARNGGANLYN